MRLFGRWVLMLVLSATIIQGQALAAETFAYTEFVDAFMKKVMEQHPVVGGAVAIVEGGKIAFLKGYGYSDLKRRIKIDPESSVFRVASVAKLLTSLAAMKLIDEGRLDADAPVNFYLKQFHIDDEAFNSPVLIRHLLTHTEGFEQQMIGAKTLVPENIRIQKNFLQENRPTLFFEPGKMITYGNSGSAVLGAIVEDVSGMPFEVYLEKAVFAPLEMKNSTFAQPLPKELQARRVVEYRQAGESFDAVPGSYSHMVSAGGLHSTAADLARLVVAFREGSDFLSPKALERMLATQYRQHPELPGTTFGFLEGEYKNVRYLYRSGDSEGGRAGIFLLPDSGLGLILLLNGEGEEVRRLFIRYFLDAFFPTPENFGVARQISADIRAYEGTYRYAQYARGDFTKIMPLFLDVNVEANDDLTLTVTPLGEEPFGHLDEQRIFFPIMPNLFESAGGEVRVLFSAEANGEVYLFSGAGYHGVYRKNRWYEDAALHKGLYLAFAVFFLFHPLFLAVARLRSVRLFRIDTALGAVSLLNALFFALYFPILFLWGMSPGLLAFVKGLTPAMYALFALPLVSLGVFLLLLLGFFVRKRREYLKKRWHILLINALFFAYILYWRAFFW